MLVRWNDLGREWALLDDFRRRMDALFGEMDTAWGIEPRAVLPSLRGGAASWPAVNLYDTDARYVVEADLPGASEKDIQITATQDVLSLSGERTTQAPEGYSVHRQERGSVSFSRSFTLPGRIDPEKVEARLRDGVLTVTLEKAPEARPKKVSIKA